MELEWMGRYRELIRELIYHSNSVALSRNYHLKSLKNGITLTKHEYQVLEYLVEFPERNRIQADIAHDLGLLPSMMTNVVKHLLELGLIERYHIHGNRKSIVSKITHEGEQAYWEICQRDAQPLFEPFFAKLEKISDQDMQAFIDAFRFYNRRGDDFGYTHLEKMKE